MKPYEIAAYGLVVLLLAFLLGLFALELYNRAAHRRERRPRGSKKEKKQRQHR